MPRRPVMMCAAALTALALAACAGGSGGGGAAAGADGSGSAAAADPSAILKVGAELSSNQGPMFDMTAGHIQGVSTQWLDLIYDTMIRKTTDGLKPQLATSWKVVDAQTLDITLRAGVKFQDGTPFDAEAVAYAWNRPKPKYARPEIRAITEVKVVAPDKVQVLFASPVAGSFVTAVMVDPLFPVPSMAALKASGDDAQDHPVGAGPYAFDAYAPDQRISVRKWDGYWDPAAQKLAGVDFLNVATGAPRITALASGQIQVGQVAAKDLPAVRRQNGLAVEVRPSPATYGLLLCQNKAPFDQPELRAALAQAVDRESLNDGMFQGAGTPTSEWFGPDSPNYDKELADRHPFDVAAARAAWKNAGGPSSFTLFATTADPEGVTGASILQAQLKEIGVDVRIETSPDVFSVGRTGAHAMINPIRPETYAPYFVAGGTLNWCGYSNPALLDAYKVINGGAGTEQETKAAWTSINTLFADELPAVWLVNTPVIVARAKAVSGIDVIRPIVGMAADLRGVAVAK